jgi:hypothetical protein
MSLANNAVKRVVHTATLSTPNFMNEVFDFAYQEQNQVKAADCENCN